MTNKPLDPVLPDKDQLDALKAGLAITAQQIQVAIENAKASGYPTFKAVVAELLAFDSALQACLEHHLSTHSPIIPLDS